MPQRLATEFKRILIFPTDPYPRLLRALPIILSHYLKVKECVYFLCWRFFSLLFGVFILLSDVGTNVGITVGITDSDSLLTELY